MLAAQFEDGPKDLRAPMVGAGMVRTCFTIKPPRNELAELICVGSSQLTLRFGAISKVDAQRFSGPGREIPSGVGVSADHPASIIGDDREVWRGWSSRGGGRKFACFEDIEGDALITTPLRVGIAESCQEQ
jgi:hypothetical protein